MTVSDPGAGQQQGREEPMCGWRPEKLQHLACFLTPGHGPLMPHSLGAAPSPTPPAQDSGREGCTCDAPLSSCTPGCPCTSCDALRDSGRDEAREAVARWLCRANRGIELSQVNPLGREVHLRHAEQVLALPELDKLLRRPA